MAALPSGQMSFNGDIDIPASRVSTNTVQASADLTVNPINDLASSSRSTVQCWKKTVRARFRCESANRVQPILR
ncbi:hypothetical protein O9993_21420 [Vibrio lentus]|nr:hypothetical protein [Vibrio lentus]